MGLNVNQEILRLDVPVADTLAVDVRQRPQHLVHVELDQENRHALVRPNVVLIDLVHGIRHVLQHQVQVQIVRVSMVRAGRRLVGGGLGRSRWGRGHGRRPTGGVETVFQLHYVWMIQLPDNLQLTVLEPPVLEHLLYRHNFIGLNAPGLEHHAKRPVPYHFDRLVPYGIDFAAVENPVRALRRDGRRGPRRVPARHLALPHRLPSFTLSL
mmetsp:Transcript_8606/g.23343  ORF Transcript_8606/g.23343 Transcript_8606/m.23343 type:complete len:211 (-) Transcript_8606:297-929(-)